VLRAPWATLSGGTVIVFDVTGPAETPPTPDHSFDVVLAASGLDESGGLNLCQLVVRPPSNQIVRVSEEAILTFLDRELLLPAGYVLACVATGGFAPVEHLVGYLLRVTLVR